MKNNWPWKVIIAAIVINLVIGVIYAWSVFEKALVEEWQWTYFAASLPYAVGINVYSFGMIVAGMMQDRFGPRCIATWAAAAFGLGLGGAALSYTPLLLSLSFGVLIGGGTAFAYASALPTPMKWLPPQKRGLISGLTISAFALTAVYLSPIADAMVSRFGISVTFGAMAVVITPILLAASQFLKTPPPDYDVQEHFAGPGQQASKTEAGSVAARENDMTWREMLRTGVFYQLFFLYFCAAVTGQMVIGHISSIASIQIASAQGSFFAGVLALCNCLGRVCGGLISDRFSRRRVLVCIYVVSALNMACFGFYGNVWQLTVGCILAGLCFGAAMAIIPVSVADCFGLTHFGLNFGCVSLSSCLGGLCGPLLAGYIMDQTGSYRLDYLLTCAILVCGVTAALKLKEPTPADSRPEGALPG